MNRTLIIIIICLIGLIGLMGIVVFKRPQPTDNLQPTTYNQSGSLIINTDKSVYSPGDRVYIQITSLDENGKADCDSNLELSVTNNQQLTTYNQIAVSPSSTCKDQNSYSPDYTAFFTPEDEGEYTLTLENKDNANTTESVISVSSTNTSAPRSLGEVGRWGASKVTASEEKRYPMKLIFKANEDFEGQIVDNVPLELNIVWYGPAKIDKVDSGQKITWEVNLKAGEEKELTYEYSLPEATGKSFSLGPTKIIKDGKAVFEENRLWNIVINN